jgi:myo-inositol-1(or 4)-monophosphatase
MADQSWYDVRDLAREIARRSGELIREGYGRLHSVRTKTSEKDLVTEVDLASEQLLLDAIRARYPGHGILAEETQAGAKLDSEWLWMVDPLDGTTNYAHGFPVCAVSIGVQFRGRVVAGVVYDPLRNEMFHAVAGGGAWLGDEPLQVSTVDRFSRGLVATGFGYDRATNPDNNLGEFNRVLMKAQVVRRAGSAALDLAYVAAGRLDAYWEFRLYPWDWAAGSLLVTEAGGRISDVHGGVWRIGSCTMAASNGRIHDDLLTILAR